ncbi:hypothetical protein AGMMS49573_01660 [Endomicrobiia bacterium]|nr:hypothetical protein AGMMS49573_01660 [Endomicrobiia bacterium]
MKKLNLDYSLLSKKTNIKNMGAEALKKVADATAAMPNAKHNASRGSEHEK